MSKSSARARPGGRQVSSTGRSRQPDTVRAGLAGRWVALGVALWNRGLELLDRRVEWNAITKP